MSPTSCQTAPPRVREINYMGLCAPRQTILPRRHDWVASSLSTGAQTATAHQLATHEDGRWQRNPSSLERYMFECFPTVLPTRERFNIFQREVQALVRPGIVASSIPCGLMGDLRLLDYRQCSYFRLIGIDLHPHALSDARVVDLYRAFLRALRPGGTLITRQNPRCSYAFICSWDLYHALRADLSIV